MIALRLTVPVLFFTIVSVILLGASLGHSAASSNRILFEVPPGNCLLEPNAHQEDKGFWDFIEGQIDNDQKVISVFAKCTELEKLRAGHLFEMKNYGVLFNMGKPKQLKNIKYLGRGDFLEHAGRAFRVIRLEMFEKAGKRIQARLNLIGVPVKSLRLTTTGLLSKDERGLYVGYLLSMLVGSEQITTAIVSGMTVLDGRVISYNVYRPFEGRESFNKLTVNAKNGLERLDDVNGYWGVSEFFASHLKIIDWLSVALFGLIGGAIGVLLQILIVGYRKFFA